MAPDPRTTEATPAARPTAPRRRGSPADDQSPPSHDRRRGQHAPARAAPRGSEATRSERPAAPSAPRRRRSLLGGVAASLPYVLGGIVLVVYFVWLMSQMSTFAHGGLAVPETTFGAIFLGILAGGAAFIGSRGRRS